MNGEHSETRPDRNLSAEPGRQGIAPDSATKTQPAPNISTEHQKQGDARKPGDTLDRGQD